MAGVRSGTFGTLRDRRQGRGTDFGRVPLSDDRAGCLPKRSVRDHVGTEFAQLSEATSNEAFFTEKRKVGGSTPPLPMISKISARPAETRSGATAVMSDCVQP
jgi:hypothetical protein